MAGIEAVFSIGETYLMDREPPSADPGKKDAFMMGFIRKSLVFAKALSLDSRIPARDKAVLAGMLALLVSPFDIIPDFIPVLGQLDDLMIAILMLDYICNRVPDEILRDHFPWDPAKLLAWRSRVGFFTGLVPHWAKQKIWQAEERQEGLVKDAGTSSGSA